MLLVVCVGKTSLIRLTRALSTRVGAGTRQMECQSEAGDPDACQDTAQEPVRQGGDGDHRLSSGMVMWVVDLVLNVVKRTRRG